ncbi:MAG: hypothetical protein N2749_00465 [Clostridia bacterium]|nr:hypothetical protein [Clostridia bacterium]
MKTLVFIFLYLFIFVSSSARAQIIIRYPGIQGTPYTPGNINDILYIKDDAIYVRSIGDFIKIKDLVNVKQDTIGCDPLTYFKKSPPYLMGVYWSYYYRYNPNLKTFTVVYDTMGSYLRKWSGNFCTTLDYFFIYFDNFKFKRIFNIPLPNTVWEGIAYDSLASYLYLSSSNLCEGGCNGVWRTRDTSRTWEYIGFNGISIHDLKIYNRELYVATRWRGLWKVNLQTLEIT